MLALLISGHMKCPTLPPLQTAAAGGQSTGDQRVPWSGVQQRKWPITGAGAARKVSFVLELFVPGAFVLLSRRETRAKPARFCPLTSWLDLRFATAPRASLLHGSQPKHTEPAAERGRGAHESALGGKRGERQLRDDFLVWEGTKKSGREGETQAACQLRGPAARFTPSTRILHSALLSISPFPAQTLGCPSPASTGIPPTASCAPAPPQTPRGPDKPGRCARRFHFPPAFGRAPPSAAVLES
ncbi:hypothetical protein AOLI_G00092080 [Acnodon oligacanthus]